MIEKERKQTVDSKYIQQHLANERTYLAWIRTAIAMAGIGFVFLNFHFSLQLRVLQLEGKVVAAVGMIFFLLGVAAIIFSTVDFLNKRKQINAQTFQSPVTMVFIMSMSLIFVILILIVSYFFV
ncbi:DUF202 domain-containing protein [Fictibacillus enclensis]|jgi:putative membrane protein|uniref:YidH family protein n=1 Tax=Fictibacillus enclensis TaxID=1017270 RepID=UPI0025A0DBCD|nr:DUF202 domain-containing protein [Fictibacillus enclensis]MDM5336763.1 DUF202 domain-containing protein [Fictibacillus enclensis]